MSENIQMFEKLIYFFGIFEIISFQEIILA